MAKTSGSAFKHRLGLLSTPGVKMPLTCTDNNNINNNKNNINNNNNNNTHNNNTFACRAWASGAFMLAGLSGLFGF